MEVQNGRTRILIDAQTGSPARIEDATTGLRHVDAYEGGRNDGRLFRVVAPTELWFSRYADSHEQAAPEISRDAGGVTIRYPGLVAHGDQTGIAAEVRVDLSEGQDELRFCLRLENRGRGEVNSVIFPWLGGWTGQGGPGKDEMVIGGVNTFNPHSLPRPGGPSYARARQRVGFCYPVEMYAPWVDLSGPGGGLSYVNYMPEALNGIFSIENLAGYESGLRLAFGWEHPVVLGPGETWTSPTIGVAAHGGDWHETADRYKAWMDVHLQPAPTSSAARRMIGFQNVFFRGFDGTPIRRLEELPQVAAIGRRYGVDHLCVWDELTLGNYARHGARDLTDYTDAEREALKRGLEQARAEGTGVSALVNFRHPNPVLSLSQEQVQSRIKRCYDGTAQTENWSGSHNHGTLFVKHLGPESYIYSPFSPDHCERVLRLTRDYLELGYNSMFYDQPFEVRPDYGFIAQGHRPETTHAKALELIARVRDVLLQNDPEALIIGEECDPFGSQWIDLWMSWALSDPGAELRGARIRYSLPRTMVSWMVDSELDRATLGFALGMYLCLCVHGSEGALEDEPELAAHVASLAKLRQVCAERTVLAEFRHTRGISVDGDDGLVAYSYESAAGPAAIVAAPGREAAGTVTIDRAAFVAPGDPDEGAVWRLDGSREQVRGDAQRFTLEENEVAVWIA